MNNYSKQREIILDVLKNCYSHPTIEELYDILHKKYPTISKSTLYRNINILVENNVIKKIKTFAGADRYDYIHKEHFHAVCENCGMVFDFEYNFNIDNLSNILSNRITLEKYNLTVYGICNDCKQKKED